MDEKQKSRGEGREKRKQNETRWGWFSLGALYTRVKDEVNVRVLIFPKVLQMMDPGQVSKQLVFRLEAELDVLLPLGSVLTERACTFSRSHLN